MNSPKDRFLTSKEDAAFLLTLTFQPQFLRAVDAALLQMQSKLPDASDQQGAACQFHKICGAKEFIKELLTMAEPVKPLPQKVSDNLPENRR
jgi:hypothetical protein